MYLNNWLWYLVRTWYAFYQIVTNASAVSSTDWVVYTNNTISASTTINTAK